jgi:hypothetical protein
MAVGGGCVAGVALVQWNGRTGRQKQEVVWKAAGATAFSQPRGRNRGSSSHAAECRLLDLRCNNLMLRYWRCSL